MARFPKSEPETVTLAQAMAGGLAVDPDTGANPNFPTPPVVPAALTTLIDEYTTARNAAITAQAVAEQATTTKDTKLAGLIDGMKKDLRYAENTVNYDDEKLKLIGWAGRKAATATEAPGQSRLLTAQLQGDGWVKLEWRAPIDGGKPSAYRIMRRQRPEGPWSDVGTAVVTEQLLPDQPRGIEFEYRIIAVNKAGDGEPSNTVVVVL
jgi:hypothetical protein